MTIARIKFWAIVATGFLVISIPTAAQTDQKHAGVLLIAVDPEGPAAAAGIERGDLILRFEGQDVTNHRDIVELLAIAKTAEVTLTIKHGDDLRDQVVQIDRVWGRPRLGVMIAIGAGINPDFMKPGDKAKRKHGVEQGRKLKGREPQSQLKKRLPRMPGIIVMEVISGSPADIAGLQRGDWITIVGDVALNGPAEQLVDIIGSSRPGDELRIKYERDGQEMSVVVTLGKDSETSLTKLGIRYKTPMPMFVDENMKKLLGDHRGQYRLPPIKPGAARYHRL
uniref:PDZ domain-containing protein n=1 Tax=uncultured Spirochaetales bacterium HF0500_06B09 TaxID=710994 RepID=E0XY86_9SPIR|nr:hypothetical protein [uncultured Spirochaetales bacterium HF0500_06B09]